MNDAQLLSELNKFLFFSSILLVTFNPLRLRSANLSPPTISHPTFHLISIKLSDEFLVSFIPWPLSGDQLLETASFAALSIIQGSIPRNPRRVRVLQFQLIQLPS